MTLSNALGRWPYGDEILSPLHASLMSVVAFYARTRHYSTYRVEDIPGDFDPAEETHGGDTPNWDKLDEVDPALMHVLVEQCRSFGYEPF